MNLIQTFKGFLGRIDPFDQRIKKILKTKDSLMLDKLAELFHDKPVQTVSQILNSVNNFVQFVEEKAEGNQEKINQAIDHIKNIFDSHKK